MMDSEDIQELLETISGIESRNEKTRILASFLEDESFRKVVEHAYDPFMTFGILRMPSPHTSSGSRGFDEGTWALLDALAKREFTGNAARDAVRDELEGLDAGSRKLLKNILNKDLRAGFNVKLINKAEPGLIPAFPYMRCSLLKDVDVESFDWKKGVFSQEKADGMFINVNVDKDATMHTRQGHMFPVGSLGIERSLRENLRHGYQYHGEILVKKGVSVLDRKTGNGLLNSVMQGGSLDGHAVFLKLWDVVPLDAVRRKIEYVTPYAERFKELLKDVEGLEDVDPAPTAIVKSVEEAWEHFEEMTKQGYEGTILKDPHGTWRDGTSKFQVKMKKERECELRVIGYTEGKGKNEDTFGSLFCVSEDGSLAVGVSGFTDEEREEIADNFDDWLDSVITVRYNEVIHDKNTGEHSLFLPRFVERRADRVEADDLPRILSI